MAATYEPVSPIIMDDHLGRRMSGPPEITVAGTESQPNSYDFKTEHSSFDAPQPQQSQSWRTRLVGAGRGPTISVTEVHKNESQPTPPYEPVQNQETVFPPITEDEMRSLRTNFHPPSQLRELLFKGFLKWLVSAALFAAIGGIMYHYTLVTPMTSHDKQVYNFLVVLLSLALSMNLASSLKEMAMDLRWWVLSLRKRNFREVDLILRLDSLTAVCKLGFVAPRLLPACVSWLLLNIAVQLAIALIGLSYSPDSQTDIALVSPGPVRIPDMSQVYTEAHTIDAKSDTTADQEYTANNFGNMALGFHSADSSAIPEQNKLWAANMPIIFSGSDDSDESFWTYVFLDYNAALYNDSIVSSTVSSTVVNPPRIYTNRTINATCSCESFLVFEGGNGSSTNITILVDSNGNNRQVTLPYAGGTNQTTFITNPNGTDCGPGCSVVNALEASKTKPWWYECKMTVSGTQNATLPEHQVGDALRALAGSGIALQGHISNPVQLQVGDQFQSYPDTSLYGYPSGGDTSSMGSTIAYFAIGVVAAAADWNPALQVQGDSPQTGSQLEVEWDFIAIIFGVTCGLQLILFVGFSLVANLVIIKSDSPLATARLLRPIVDRLGSAGTAAPGKKICELLDDQHEEEVVYSVKHPQQGILHHLSLGHEKRLRAFPRGYYD